jgi:phage terminase small subunit
MQSPLLGVVNQCVDTITKLSREFGLTPAARSRIIAHTEPEEDDELERLLNSPRLPRPERDLGMKVQ